MINKYKFQEKLKNAYPDNLSERVPTNEDDGLHQTGLDSEEIKNQIVYGWRGFQERKWLAKLLDLQDGQKILELGSCWGDQSIFLGENIRYGTIYALDPIMPRQKLLGDVLKKYEFEDKTENRNIVPVAGDLFNLGFKENTIDRILAADVIEVICELNAYDRMRTEEFCEYPPVLSYELAKISCVDDALASIYSVLKSGGKAVITGEITTDIEKPVLKSVAHDIGFKKCEYVKSKLYSDVFDDLAHPTGERKRSTFRAIVLEK